jgi:hypothetical protein
MYYGPSKGGRGSTIAKVAIVGLTLAAAGVALYFVFKPKDTVTRGDFTITVSILTPQVPISGTVKIQVTVKNNSDKPKEPEFRFDIWPSGHTPVEGYGSQQTVALEAGDSETFVMERTLESNWGEGTNINAQLMLLGITAPVWSRNGAFKISTEQNVVSAEEVECLTPSVIAGIGAKAKVRVAVTNTTSSTINRTFQLDVKCFNCTALWAAGWKEGTAYRKYVAIPAGGGEFELECDIPQNWGPQNGPLALKIMNIGVSGPWWGDTAGSGPYRLVNLISVQDPDVLTVPEGTEGVTAVKQWVPINVKPQVKVRIQNSSGQAFTKQFRLDCRTTGGSFKWMSGYWQSIDIRATDAIQEFTLSGNTFPAEYYHVGIDNIAAHRVATKIMINGETTPFWGQEALNASSLPFELFQPMAGKGGVYAPSGDPQQLIMTAKTPTDGLLSQGGEAFSVTLNIKYKGGGKNYLVGVGIKDLSSTGKWASKTVFFPETTLDEGYVIKSVTVNGNFSTTLAKGRKMAILKTLQIAGGPLKIAGNPDAIVEDWDQDVFTVA